MRGRLKALFVPTDAGDAIAELIAVHAQELEARSEELRASLDELEQREARARELHARVEQVLRDGSAELDVRQAEIATHAAELDRRESSLNDAEARLAERAREVGAVELRSAAVARREQALLAGENELERRATELAALARRLDDGLEAAFGIRVEHRDDAHIALTVDGGYHLLEREGAAPAAGDAVELEGRLLRCVRVTSSPYPDDRRLCAVLEPGRP